MLRSPSRSCQAHLLPPALPTTGGGQSDTTHHLRLADVERGNPCDDLFVIKRWGEHRQPPSEVNGRATVRRESQGKSTNLVLVLDQKVRNIEGPNKRLPNPA